MYLILHRALRNAGDFLIFERARALIRSVRPNVELVPGRAWLPLAGQFTKSELAACRAIVVCGGPGYGRGLHPRIYPLGDPASLPPILLLALGSAILPGTDRQLATFDFDPPSRDFLEAIVGRGLPLGARDRLTDRLLHRLGFADVAMVGDPAWYALEALDGPIRVPRQVRAIAFTPPANPAYFGQAMALFDAVQRQFADARMRVVHHRGIQLPFARRAARRGWDTVDITGSAEGFEVYDRADLHVGYRVHAHLYSLSRAVPSYLVAEDSRGRGVHDTLGPLGALGFDPEGDDGAARSLIMRWLPRVANAYRPVTSALSAPASRLLGLPDVTDEVLGAIDADRAAGFPRHAAARETIRATMPEMQRLIEALP